MAVVQRSTAATAAAAIGVLPRPIPAPTGALLREPSAVLLVQESKNTQHYAHNSGEPGCDRRPDETGGAQILHEFGRDIKHEARSDTTQNQLCDPTKSEK